MQRQKPWARFLMGCTLISVAIVAAGLAFHARYRIAVDTQATPCLDARVLLIDLKDKTPVKGKLMAFTASKSTEPFYKEGTLMAKIVFAEPGDAIEIKPNEYIYVNGEAKVVGLPHLQGIKPVDRKAFFGKTTLKANQWWVVGQHPLSFDSRYWGAVNNTQWVGRAYVVF